MIMTILHLTRLRLSNRHSQKRDPFWVLKFRSLSLFLCCHAIVFYSYTGPVVRNHIIGYLLFCCFKCIMNFESEFRVVTSCSRLQWRPSVFVLLPKASLLFTFKFWNCDDVGTLAMTCHCILSLYNHHGDICSPGAFSTVISTTLKILGFICNFNDANRCM